MLCNLVDKSNESSLRANSKFKLLNFAPSLLCTQNVVSAGQSISFDQKVAGMQALFAANFQKYCGHFCPALTKLALGLHVKRWVCVFRSFFQGLFMLEILASGCGSGIPLLQDIVISNARAWLSNATLRFLNLA